MKIRKLIGVLWLGATVMLSCKKLYAPHVVSSPGSYLVVEGIVVAGSDSTVINLSRSVQLTGTTAKKPEIAARVTVDDGQGASYTLPEIDSGRYAAASLDLDNSHRYRLSIITADGQTYVSDYVPVKMTPPIDTVSYQLVANGLNIFVNAHDLSNRTRFYRWDYTETYIYETPLISDFIFDPKQSDPLKMSVPRPPAQQIHTCWVTLNSSAININSSARLSEDVIANNPITQVSRNSEKILYRYSILVKQYALTQDAYNFWNLLKTNTQQIGTIFDAQPSTNKGNIHCTSNPSLPVIGYVSACTIAQKRIFIDRQADLLLGQGPTGSTISPDTICWFKSAALPPKELYNGVLIPMDTVQATGVCYKDITPSYSIRVAFYNEADCRYHLDGTTQKPAFWK